MDLEAAVFHPKTRFQLAEERGWDWREVLDFSEPVNPLGPAPGVREAIRGALERVDCYPDAWGSSLTAKLARRWQVAPAQILLGNGATELIHFTARMWRKEAAALAAPVPLEFHRAHPAALIVKWNEPHRWPDSGLVFFAQPNDPIGQTIGPEQLHDWLAGTKNPVIVDESYIEFTEAPSLIPMIGARPNLFVLRSLSKFYALAGLRIGALVGDEANIASLREKREPWQVNVLAETAAHRSLDDLDHAARTKALVAEEREWLWRRLRRIPVITPVRSEANYMLIYLTSGVQGLVRYLESHKVLVRDCTGWPGVEGEAIRIAVRTRPENERFVRLMERYF